jgi:hypothetical protein
MDRSHALRGNAFGDAERPGMHSHAERGNDHQQVDGVNPIAMLL